MKNKSFGSYILIVFLGVFLANCGGDDVQPVIVGPSITVSVPVDNTKFSVGNAIVLSADLSSGSNLTTLTASVTTKLKGLLVVWKPESKIVTLNGSTTQALRNLTLFETIPSNAQEGYYVLVLEVKDSAGKTVIKEIPFEIMP